MEQEIKFMKNIKIWFLIFIMAVSFSSIFAAQNHISVPVDHRVYSILRIAEIRGLIDSVMEVRPFSASKILNYLEIIKQSNNISDNEKTIIEDLIAEFTKVQPDNSFKTLATYGSYSTYSEKYDLAATMGAKLNFEYAHSLSDLSRFDSRNGGDLFIRGDIKDIASFNLNIGIRFDHIDYNLFLKNDFKIPTKGKYDTFWDHQEEHSFYYGIYGEPEISVSLLNNNLTFRWASIERDWGVGENNFMLSKDANSINGVELNFEVTSWLRYAFFAGSLGKFSSEDVLFDRDKPNSPEFIFYNTYFPSDYLHHNAYNNNFSAHRVELNLPFNIKFGIYESVVYRKRFELGYLNPLSILMFEQNIMGDFDNMLAGFDVQYTLKDYFRVYINAATTEMNEGNPKRFFIAPRNVLSMQAGADVNLPFISFSSATLQYTYLAPFFYAHKPVVDGNYKKTEELSMVHEGRNIGYPLRPNSDEFLVKFNLNFKNNWDGSFTFKYQRRSGQYGFDIEKWMFYTAANNGAYDDKKFNANVFEKTIGIDATVNKTLNNYPIRLSASYIFVMNNQRENLPKPLKVWDRVYGKKIDYKSASHSNYDKYPVVEYEVSGPWKGWEFSHALRLGVNIWL
jgi:hypothetical protein